MQVKPAKPVCLDFSQRKLLKEYHPVSDDKALERWIQKIAEYRFLEEGDLDTIPDDVPEDLLSPDKFVEIHGVDDPALLHHDYNQGVGYGLEQIALYVAKLMN